MQRTLAAFLRTEAGGGVLLVLAAFLAVALANSPWGESYFALLRHPLGLDRGFWSVDFTFRSWVMDGLMAIYFYVIGLELKRELTVGELSDRRTVWLPVASAIGGALAPVVRGVRQYDVRISSLTRFAAAARGQKLQRSADEARPEPRGFATAWSHGEGAERTARRPAHDARRACRARLPREQPGIPGSARSHVRAELLLG